MTESLPNQDRGPMLKSAHKMWALTNFGNLHSVHRTRKDAVQRAIRQSGESWESCSKYYEIRKVRVTEGWPQHFGVSAPK